ncbi:maltase 2-like [Phlebotomus argentipes]|uniref:maltase 2-like n=1 Tax=Phlebotomus argentipes TaxID=94469 RepID=UPI0028935BAB|nr:maltase 2-like [Phlebotomus argentipes]
MGGLIQLVGILCLALTLSSAREVKSANKQTEDTQDWYEHAVFYQIYPRSFMDSDGNGVGDIKGITSKLGHLKDLGVTGTWLSPIFTSPMKDFGYDIANFTEVDEIFGTLDDLKELFATAKSMGIKIILDFVPNHSSNLCKWFEWSENRENGYDDWYVWVDAKEIVDGVPVPPTNWVSVFYGPAWTWSEKRQQFYLHQFDYQQPDLNFRNPVVVEAMKDVMRYWLEMGADGFRVDAINHLFEKEPLQDEPENWWGVTDPNDYGFLDHIYTKDLDETYDMIYQWRELLDDWQKQHGGDTRIMMTEAWVDDELFTRYYGASGREGSHMPFNFVLITQLNEHSKPSDFKRVIDERLRIIPDGKFANWVLGNHDKNRVGTRYGAQMVEGMLALEMGLPGVAVTYYGEEIGMLDNKAITWEETQDPQACNPQDPSRYQELSRDPARTPMQWDNSAYAGFSSVTPWLPVNSNYGTLNLARQSGQDRSVYHFYKDLVAFRQVYDIIYGDYESKVLADDSIFAYRRTSEFNGETSGYVFVINFSGSEHTLDMTQSFDFLAQHNIYVDYASSGSSYEQGTKIDPAALVVGPYDALVLGSSGAKLIMSLTLIFAVVARFLFLQ